MGIDQLVKTGLLGLQATRDGAPVAAQVGSGELIDRDPRADVGAGGLAGLHPGEEGGQRPGMVAGTVPVGLGFALREAGFETVMVNSNPETVSTDYDTSDLLFFENAGGSSIIRSNSPAFTFLKYSKTSAA